MLFQNCVSLQMCPSDNLSTFVESIFHLCPDYVQPIIHYRLLEARCPVTACLVTLSMWLLGCRSEEEKHFLLLIFPTKSTGEPMKIQISSETKMLLDNVGGFICEPRGQVSGLEIQTWHLSQVQVKGRGFMDTHWLLCRI